MPITPDRIVRFAAGTPLRFVPALSMGMLGAIRQARPEFAALIAALPQMRGIVESVIAERCALRFEVHDAALIASLVRDAAGNWLAHWRWHRDGENTHGQGRRPNIVLMLGGTQEAYVAERTDSDPRFLLKLRYDADQQSVTLWVFAQALADHVSAAARAFLPREVLLGTLQTDDRQQFRDVTQVENSQHDGATQRMVSETATEKGKLGQGKPLDRGASNS